LAAVVVYRRFFCGFKKRGFKNNKNLEGPGFGYLAEEYFCAHVRAARRGQPDYQLFNAFGPDYFSLYHYADYDRLYYADSCFLSSFAGGGSMAAN